MTRLVVDSCVAVKWFIREEDSDAAHSLLAGQSGLIAPDIALAEIANALWKAHKRRIVDQEEVQRRLKGASRFFNQLLPTNELLDDGLELACTIDHPIYDCLYVVVSRRMGAPLVTTDSRLIARLAGTADMKNVVHLAHWTPTP
jgi:predicted nucleic acid-binding protein